MAQVFTVTANTSVVSISTLQAPNTVVLLSSITYPGHIVGIRDATGLPSIAVNPIIVSTTTGLQFYDGTSSIVINIPNGQVSVSSRNPTTWQVLNTVGFFTTLSNAFLETLTATYGYFQTFSSVTQNVSTLNVNQLNVTNSIFLLGNAEITGNIIVAGGMDIFSTAQFLQDIRISSGLTVGGNVTIPSTLTIGGDLVAGRGVSTFMDVIVGKNLFIQSTLTTFGAILPKGLSVQTALVDTLNVGGGLYGLGNISTHSNLVVGNSLTVEGKARILDSIVVNASTTIQDNAFFGGNVETVSADIVGKTAISKDLFVGQTLTTGNLSSVGDVFVLQSTSVQSNTFVHGDIFVTGPFIVDNAVIGGSATYQNVSTNQTVVSQDASIYGNFTTQNLVVGSNIGVGGNALILGTLNIKSQLSTQTNLNVGNDLIVLSTLITNGDASILRSFIDVSTLNVTGLTSTNTLNVNGDLTVIGNATITNQANLLVLGAPISLVASTLFLSNTLNIQSEGTIPFLQTADIPSKMLAGLNNLVNQYDINIDEDVGVRDLEVGFAQMAKANVRSLELDNSSSNPNFFGYLGANDELISTIQGGGNIPIVSTPQVVTNGFLVGGDTPAPGFNNILASSDGVNYSNIGSGIPSSNPISNLVYNGTDLWVATIFSKGGSVPNTFYSSNASNWNGATDTLFSVFSLVYANGLWLQGGNTAPPNVAPPSIKYSTDGKIWSPCFNMSLYLTSGLAYNGSNLWLAVGGSFTSIFGVNYSEDGIYWNQATPPTGVPYLLQQGNVAFGGVPTPFWLIADGATFLKSFTGSNNWQVVSQIQHFNLNLYWFNQGSFQGFYAANQKDNWSTNIIEPEGSILKSADGVTWTNFFSNTLNGFGIRSITVRSNIMYAVDDLGYVYTNKTGVAGDWFQNGPVGMSTFVIAQGKIIGPSPDRYFTFDLPSYFNTTVSSVSLVASTIQASSFTGGIFIGDGGGLLNPSAFASNIQTSSINVDRINATVGVTNVFQGLLTQSNAPPYTVNYNIPIEKLTASNSFIEGDMLVTPALFPSTVNIYLAGGVNTDATARIQTSLNAKNWNGITTVPFNRYVTDITGSGLPEAPFYMATGADTNGPQNTIQYSQNGSNWSPAESGGFPTSNLDGLFKANSVIYNANQKVWIVGGDDLNGSSTIVYSTDGKNWLTPNVVTLSNSCFLVASGSNNLMALGTDTVLDSRYNLYNVNAWYAYASSPSIWTPIETTQNLFLDVIGFGEGQVDGLTQLLYDIWIGFSNTDLYYSWQDIPKQWFIFASNVVNNPVRALHFANQTWVAATSNQIYYNYGKLNEWTLASSILYVDQISDVVITWTPTFSNVNAFESIGYNSNQGIWVAGARAEFASNTLWYSSNAIQWYNALSGGFSTGVIEGGDGIGYAAITIQKSTLLTVGTGTFSPLSSRAPQIFEMFPNTQVYRSSTGFLAGFSGNYSQGFTSLLFGSNSNVDAWTTIPTSNLQGLIALTYNGNLWVALQQTAFPNPILYSPNGLTWTPANIGFPNAGYGVAYGNGLWVAVGNGGGFNSNILYSGDGSNWSNCLSNDFPLTGYGVAYSPTQNTWRAVGLAYLYPYPIFESANGIEWFPLTSYISVGGQLNAIAFGNNLWVAINATTSNILYSGDGSNWSNGDLNFGFGQGLCVAFDSIHTLWVAGGRGSYGGVQTILYSGNGSNWSDCTIPFDIDYCYSVSYNSNLNLWGAVGRGAGQLGYILSSGDGINWSYTGVSSIGGPLNYGPIASGDILEGPFPPMIQRTVLTQSNAQNVFRNAIYGIGYSPYEENNIVAVGNGLTPQRTISRFNQTGPSTFTTLVPAISGGFKPAGYGVAYYISSSYSNWIAVGDAEVSTNTIQYSPDGANWFGTNNSQGLRLGGRGIAVGLQGIDPMNSNYTSLSTTIVAVGKDIQSDQYILHSQDGFNWISSATSTFRTSTASGLNAYGNGVAAGYDVGSNANFVAVGRSFESTFTILYSSDGISWSQTGQNGFNGEGKAVAFGYFSNDPTYKFRFMAVGSDPNPVNRIQYNLTGGNGQWIGVGPLTGFDEGFGVTYLYEPYNVWVVTGRGSGAQGSNTVFFTADPLLIPWQNLGNVSYGFQPEKSFGSANGVFTQGINTIESYPIIEMSNLIVYKRPEPLGYLNSVIRVTSTSLVFQEFMTVNMSTQVILDSNNPFGNNSLTVNGLVYASSILFEPSSNASLTDNMRTSTIVVSTFYNRDYTVADNVITPYLTITNNANSQLVSTTANSIVFEVVSEPLLPPPTNFRAQTNVNNILKTSYYVPTTAINKQNPTYQLDVGGITATSSLITKNMTALVTEASTSIDLALTDQNLNFFTGPDSNLIPTGNTFFTEPSSFTINSVVTFNVSSQRVGLYTNNPQFDFHVESLAILENVTTPTVQTGAFFVTLFSV